MRSEGRIFLAFILNLAFSVFEFFGGIFTGSVAILSDAVHDIGDAASIGVSFFLEKKSKRQPDKKYTYGYARYSVIGGLVTSLVLLFGSLLVIYNAILRIIDPIEINYDGMIIFAVVGVAVNLAAAIFTRRGDSLNQRAVSLHMLEDVLGWVVVLVGAVIMRFTDIALIDPILSICVAVFILINALRGLLDIFGILLERAPSDIDLDGLEEHLLGLCGVAGVHHLHVWSLDGRSNYATMHVVFTGDAHTVKDLVREELREHGIAHATLELESTDEECREQKCRIEHNHEGHCHHHHHHHHHGH